MKKLLLSLAGMFVVGILIGYGVSWLFQQKQPPTDEVRVVINQDRPMHEIQLFFIEPEGAFLIPEAYEIPACDDDSDCVRNLLQGLINGSSRENLPVLPKQTQILTVEIDNDLARINFSRHLRDFHPGGSLTELLSIYSLANSLNENFPYLRQLQILIDGESYQTLKGHARIDQPIYPDFSFNVPPPTGPYAATPAIDSVDQNLSIEQLIQASESAEDN